MVSSSKRLMVVCCYLWRAALILDPWLLVSNMPDVARMLPPPQSQSVFQMYIGTAHDGSPPESLLHH
tara:strand:- start:246 stop:446 length:201 start_codon:yes stop_codon:yes gene_type:complete